LSATSWKAALSDGRRQSPRVMTVKAGDIDGLVGVIEGARRKFGLPETCRKVVCQEAGRDGFWLHRRLEAAGMASLVVDSSSIEVNRRARRAKTDRLDVLKLVQMLMRHEQGEKVWSVVRVPTEEQEDARVVHREREMLLKECQRESNRIRSALAVHGLRVGSGSVENVAIDALRDAKGGQLPPNIRAKLRRDQERLKQLRRQLGAVEEVQEEALRNTLSVNTPGVKSDESIEKARMLMNLKGIGQNGAWILAFEFFWRSFLNRKEVGGAAGITGTPYLSGAGGHDQGISKAGSPRIRALAVELSWLWLRYQRDSALSKWFQRKWGHGNSRSRRVGIVALARRLLIALWRYVETGVVPEGAVLKS
jgi:transposase